MRLVRRATIATGWLVISAALLRIGSGGGGTAENVRYAIADLPVLLVLPAALTLAVAVALELAGHGSGVPLALAAGVTAALSIPEARAERGRVVHEGSATATTANGSDSRV